MKSHPLMNLALAAVVATLLPLQAGATTSNAVPEPDLWALLAVAGVAAAVITLRNRRK